MFFDSDYPADDPNLNIFNTTISNQEKPRNKGSFDDVNNSSFGDQSQILNSWVDNYGNSCPDWFSFDDSKKQQQLDHTNVQSTKKPNEQVKDHPQPQTVKSVDKDYLEMQNQASEPPSHMAKNEVHFWDRLNDDFDSLNRKIKVLGLRSPEEMPENVGLSDGTQQFIKKVDNHEELKKEVVTSTIEQTTALSKTTDKKITTNRQNINVHTDIKVKETLVCSRCSRSNNHDNNFCSSCGNKLNRFLEYPDRNHSQKNQADSFEQPMAQSKIKSSSEQTVGQDIHKMADQSDSVPYINQEKDVLQVFNSKHPSASFHHGEALVSHFPDKVGDDMNKVVNISPPCMAQEDHSPDTLDLYLLDETALKNRIEERMVGEIDSDIFWVTLRALLMEKGYKDSLYLNLGNELDSEKLNLPFENRSFSASDSISFSKSLIGADIKKLCDNFINQKAWFNALFFSSIVNDIGLRGSVFKAMIASEMHWTDPLSFYVLSNIGQFESIDQYIKSVDDKDIKSLEKNWAIILRILVGQYPASRNSIFSLGRAMSKSNPIIDFTCKIILGDLNYFHSEEFLDLFKRLSNHDQEVYIEYFESIIQRIDQKFYIPCLFDSKIEKVEKLINRRRFKEAYDMLNLTARLEPRNSSRMQNFERLFKVLAAYGYSQEKKIHFDAHQELQPSRENYAQRDSSVENSSSSYPQFSEVIPFDKNQIPSDAIKQRDQQVAPLDSPFKTGTRNVEIPSKESEMVQQPQPRMTSIAEINQNSQIPFFAQQPKVDTTKEQFEPIQTGLISQLPNNLDLQQNKSINKPPETMAFQEKILSEAPSALKESNLSEVDLSESKDQRQQKGLISKFTSLFSFGKSTERIEDTNKTQPKRANLGEPNSFYYDESLKRWVNSKNKDSVEIENHEMNTQPPLLSEQPQGSEIESFYRRNPTKNYGSKSRYVDVVNPDPAMKIL